MLELLAEVTAQPPSPSDSVMLIAAFILCALAVLFIGGLLGYFGNNFPQRVQQPPEFRPFPPQPMPDQDGGTGTMPAFLTQVPQAPISLPADRAAGPVIYIRADVLHLHVNEPGRSAGHTPLSFNGQAVRFLGPIESRDQSET